MLAPWGWLNGDAHLPPPHGVSTLNFQNSRPHIHYPFFFFFNIYETYYKVYTNKPRALLMQQALYNEPKRARLLWEDGMSVQTLGVFHFKNKLSAPFHHSPWICTCPNHPSPILNRQCTQVHLTIPGQPLWQTVTMSVLHYLWTKAQTYQILQRIQETVRQFLPPP